MISAIASCYTLIFQIKTEMLFSFLPSDFFFYDFEQCPSQYDQVRVRTAWENAELLLQVPNCPLHKL